MTPAPLAMEDSFLLASAFKRVLAGKAWLVNPLVTVKAEIVAGPLIAAEFVILRNPTFVAPKPRKLASAVRVIASVPLVVTGEPATENSPGTEIATLVTEPPPPVVAEIVPSMPTVMLELSTFTRPTVEAVATL